MEASHKDLTKSLESALGAHALVTLKLEDALDEQARAARQLSEAMGIPMHGEKLANVVSRAVSALHSARALTSSASSSSSTPAKTASGSGSGSGAGVAQAGGSKASGGSSQDQGARLQDALARIAHLELQLESARDALDNSVVLTDETLALRLVESRAEAAKAKLELLEEKERASKDREDLVAARQEAEVHGFWQIGNKNFFNSTNLWFFMIRTK